jgi:hypothetical protein
MAIATKSLFPSDMALNTATLSAHMLNPKDEFSTLQPVKISPPEVNKAAPTGKWEKGEKELRLAFLALSNNSSKRASFSAIFKNLLQNIPIDNMYSYGKMMKK